MWVHAHLSPGNGEGVVDFERALDTVVRSLLDGLDWAALLAARTGWRRDSAAGELRCADGRPLTLTTVRPGEHASGRTNIILRRPTGGCEDCESRDACLNSPTPSAQKHAGFSIPSETANRLRERLVLIRAPHADNALVAPIQTRPGPHSVADALFLPARARQTFAAVFRGATLHIEVTLPEREHTQPKLVAVDAADRQRRRKTWEQNVDRHALPEETVVRMDVAGELALLVLLADSPPSELLDQHRDRLRRQRVVGLVDEHVNHMKDRYKQGFKAV